MARLERIIYRSRATGKTGSLMNMAPLLAESQRNNARDDLTGALAAHDDRYIQIIEGTDERLDLLMRRIARDPRHTDIEVVSREPIADRAFVGWSMAQATIRPELADSLDDIMGRSAPNELLSLMIEAVPRDEAR